MLIYERFVDYYRRRRRRYLLLCEEMVEYKTWSSSVAIYLSSRWSINNAKRAIEILYIRPESTCLNSYVDGNSIRHVFDVLYYFSGFCLLSR